jgi:cob(I)alamin adenosyltransferase
VIGKNKHDIVILDELNVAIDFGLVDLEEVLEIIADKPGAMELIITGRNARKEVIEVAHYVTDMKAIKHPYEEGVMARDGIEH